MEKDKAQEKENVQEQKQEKQEKQEKQTPQESPAAEVTKTPQMVTVNGDTVTHCHVWQRAEEPDKWYLAARINDQTLRPVVISPEDAQRYINHEMKVDDMMNKYYPTKVGKHFSAEELKEGTVLSNGQRIDKFSIYKEQNPDRQDVGKYKMFTQIGDTKLSMLAPREALNAYFDKAATPAMLVEQHFGERLHLASHYEKFNNIPKEVEIDNIKFSKNQMGNWCIGCDINKVHIPMLELSFDDGFAYFKAKTATDRQLAAKYFAPQIENAKNLKLEENLPVSQKKTWPMHF